MSLDAVRRSLKGEVLVPAGEAFAIGRSLPHGDVAAVMAQAKALGLPALLGPAGRERDLALALIVSRVVHPAHEEGDAVAGGATPPSAPTWVSSAASTDEVYAAMDWLLGSAGQRSKAKLARRHLTDETTNPHRMALFDLSSSWVEGRQCPLAARGYSRDGKKGKPQIEYGLLTDPAGRPVAVRVFKGNTGDPTAFVEALTVVGTRSGCGTWSWSATGE